MTVIRRAIAIAALLLPSTAFAAKPSPCDGPIPEAPLHGTVMGKPFAPGNATVNPLRWLGSYTNSNLVFQDKPGDSMLQVQVIVRKGTLPDGKTFRHFPVIDPGQQPQAGKDATEIQGWWLQVPEYKVDYGEISGVATIRVEYGMRHDGKLPGKLAICIPGTNAVIMGSFNAKIVKL